jgi:hypothetical protein
VTPQKPPGTLDEVKAASPDAPLRDLVIAGLVLLAVIGFVVKSCAGSAPETTAADEAAHNAKVQEDEKFAAFGGTCDRLVTRNLKAPKTAEVSNYYTDQQNGTLTGSYLTGYRWMGTVDSQNSFGAMLRTTFLCTTGPAEDTVHVEFAASP